MKKPKVSVIIPSYNHEHYVKQAVESVLAQTFTNFELIVIDDASKDNSVSILQKFDDPRIRLYVHEKNCGAVATLNEGIKRAKGEYVAILNSDDAFLPKKLATQVTYLNNHPEVGATFTHVSVLHSKKKKNVQYFTTVFKQPNRTRTEWLQFFFKYGNAVCHPSVLIRKSCYKKIGYYDSRYHQLPDFDMWVRFALQFSFHIIQEPLTQFRVLPTGKNTSAKTNQTQMRHEWEFGKILHHYLSLSSDELITVFPKLQAYPKNSYSRQPHYLLHLVARELERPATQLFALDVLHALVKTTFFTKKQTETSVRHLELELIEHSGKLDVFGLKKHSFYQHELYGLKNELKITKNLINNYKKSKFFVLWRVFEKVKHLLY